METLAKPQVLTFEEILEDFKESFSTNSGTDLSTCACGITYFNRDLRLCDEEGEEIYKNYKNLQEQGKAYFEVGYSIGTYRFLGKEYADCCDCIKQNEELKSWIDGIARDWVGWMKFLLTIHKKQKDFYDSRHGEILSILGVEK